MTSLSVQMQLPKKHRLPGREPTFKSGHVPHLPSMYRYSEHQGQQQNLRPPQVFGTFLDFLTEGQVLDSLQTVVEKATEHLAATKTEAGVPLVDIQDPLEAPSDRRTRARRTVHRHHARPTLCAGHPNNYPSCSSSMSDSHSSISAGWLGSHNQDTAPGPRGIGSLPPMRDKLLLEKNLKRLLRLENKGKGLNHSCPQRDSLPWDSLDSQTSSQWTREQPLSWFSGLLGSNSATPETLGLGEQEMIFLKEELTKEIKSLLNQPASFNLPVYCSLREPHRTLDFLAEHRLFPALQRVVSQAVDKLSHACRHNGFPLFPVDSDPTPVMPGDYDLLQQNESKPNSRDGEEPSDSPTTVSSPKTSRRKSKGRRDSPSMSNAQMTTKFRLKSPSTKLPKKKPLPSISSVSSLSYISNPWFEELTNFLIEQAISLLISKYKFEESLNSQLGFVSFPVTEVLMDIFLGFKKVKGTHIRLSSDINWTCLLRKLEEAELARQAIHRASRPGASHHNVSRAGTSRPSTESHSVQPEHTGNTNQDQSIEPPFSLRHELPIHQLLNPQDPGVGQEQMPRSPSVPSAGMGTISSKSKDIENMEEGEGGEEEEEEEEEQEQEQEDRGSEEDEISDTFAGELTLTSLPEPELEDLMNESTIMRPSESP
ncbi:Coiled-coil domain-containing protein 116 [Cricetulus griseus]|uniref:Coiled-coil domain-containing protein 116 n=1 Tax=Cricetulus griseus TaxID=10029 RepID=G3HFY7_CRIGR|nr:Coiled-coil domain-containing protein 116 [Cricetulus griseus]